MFSRSVIGAGMIAGAMLFGTAATAAAQPPPPPDCTAADLAGVMSGVSAGTSSIPVHPSGRERLLHGSQGEAPRSDVN